MTKDLAKKRSDMVRLRARRDVSKLCRQCKLPAKVGADGSAYRSCQKHLDADAKRKAKARKAARR